MRKRRGGACPRAAELRGVAGETHRELLDGLTEAEALRLLSLARRLMGRGEGAHPHGGG